MRACFIYLYFNKKHALHERLIKVLADKDNDVNE